MIARHTTKNFAIANEKLWDNSKLIMFSQAQVEFPVFTTLSIIFFQFAVVATTFSKQSLRIKDALELPKKW